MKMHEIITGNIFEDVFHGSPHMFDPDPSNKLGKFKTSQIGTGEGMQAFGHGLYFASSKGVANYYRKTLSDPHWKYQNTRITDLPLNDAMYNHSPERYILSLVTDGVEKVTKINVAKALSNIDAYIKKTQEDIERIKSRMGDTPLANRLTSSDWMQIENLKQFREEIERTNPADFKYVGGYLYHVSIPDDDEYLRWELKITSQPDHIKEILLSIPELQVEIDAQNAKREQMNRDNPARLTHPIIGKLATKVKVVQDLTGQEAYEALSRKFGAPRASQYLLEHGIAGIKYLSGTIVCGGDGGYNYVVFDDSRINIKKRQ